MIDLDGSVSIMPPNLLLHYMPGVHAFIPFQLLMIS